MTSSIVEQDEDDEDFDGLFHMVPNGSLREHVCSMKCWCSPEVDEDDNDIVIHNSGSGLPH